MGVCAGKLFNSHSDETVIHCSIGDRQAEPRKASNEQQVEGQPEVPQRKEQQEKTGLEKKSNAIKMASSSYSALKLKGAFNCEGNDTAFDCRVELPKGESGFYVLRKTDSIENKYLLLEEIGRGQFGVVSVGVEKSSGKRFAIKSMSKLRAEGCKDIRTEVEVLYLLSGHPNIIQLLEVYEDSDTIHLVMELCEGGSWCDRLITGGTYSERQAAQGIHTLLKTLAYCHSLGVVHRDIKPEQILYTNHTAKATIKLADFGLAAIDPGAHLSANVMTSRAFINSYDAVGSTHYVAPEVLMLRGNGKESDIWSLGVTLFITLGGYSPFEGMSEAQTFNSIKYDPLRFNDPTWDQISSNAKDFISRMLCKDPKSRATIPELIHHPWLARCGVSANIDGTLGVSQAMDEPLPNAVISRLRNFAKMNTFKKEARKVLASLLPEEEVIGMLQIFKEMDTNHDGLLTASELHNALSSQGINMKAAMVLFETADTDRNGVIDYSEFLAATLHQIRLDKQELMLKAFQHFDTDCTGFISKEHLEGVLHSGSQMNWDKIIKEVDLDRDGKINYGEFCRLIQKQEQDLLSQFPGLAPDRSARYLIQGVPRISDSDNNRGPQRSPRRCGHHPLEEPRVHSNSQIGKVEQLLDKVERLRYEEDDEVNGSEIKAGRSPEVRMPEPTASVRWRDNFKDLESGSMRVLSSKAMGCTEVHSRRPSLKMAMGCTEVHSRRPSLKMQATPGVHAESISRMSSRRRREQVVSSRNPSSIRWRDDIGEQICPNDDNIKCAQSEAIYNGGIQVSAMDNSIYRRSSGWPNLQPRSSLKPSLVTSDTIADLHQEGHLNLLSEHIPNRIITPRPSNMGDDELHHCRLTNRVSSALSRHENRPSNHGCPTRRRSSTNSLFSTQWSTRSSVDDKPSNQMLQIAVDVQDGHSENLRVWPSPKGPKAWE